MHDFEDRIDEITDQLIQAAENVGFFTLPDSKESYQLQFGENMNDLWVKYDDLPGFRTASLDFMNRVQQVSECLMRCFAWGLGFPERFFIECHRISRPNSQTTMRLLHYFALSEVSDSKVYHRAGAHADWDFLTLLFQRDGQDGLEICPSRELVTEFGIGDEWTKVKARTGEIVCNIGDLLMSWSDASKPRPCKDSLIQGPLKKYPIVTGAQFTDTAMKRNFAALQEKLKPVAAA
ncbi:Oxoglutarate/iron-dependent dioxygenase [Penicillium sp. CMV-2018d]|nr:Oxoglutarate/iron-dependent dioxygenase [Penicillium sp. CMV-2018d]